MENTLGQNLNSKIENLNIASLDITGIPVEDRVLPESSADLAPVQKVEVDQGNPEDLDEVWSRWKCLVCGYNYEGRLKIVKCPRCGNEDPDKFEDAD